MNLWPFIHCLDVWHPVLTKLPFFLYRLTALLVYLLEVKSSKEEDFLIAKYGIDYTEYMEKVPGKFFPADLLDDLPWNKKEDL